MRVTLSPRTVSFSFRSTNAMQSILPLFKLGSNTWQNFASKFLLVTKGRVSLARGRKRADRCLLAFTNWQFESVRKLPYEGAPSTKKIRRALEDPLRENSKSRREACSNDWWAFKGVSLDSLSVSLSRTKDLRIGMRSHENENAWSQPRKCILEDKRPGNAQWLPSPGEGNNKPSQPLFSLAWKRLSDGELLDQTREQ